MNERWSSIWKGLLPTRLHFFLVKNLGSFEQLEHVSGQGWGHGQGWKRVVSGQLKEGGESDSDRS